MAHMSHESRIQFSRRPASCAVRHFSEPVSRVLQEQMDSGIESVWGRAKEHWADSFTAGLLRTLSLGLGMLRD